jgi:hypothetical protein
LYKWYYTCALDCGGDPEVFQANWLGATQHYREKLALSDGSAVLLNEFLVLFASDINTYTRCRSTALVEGLHSLSNKYVAKRVHYGFKRYCARKGLAVLDWNENVHNKGRSNGRKRIQRTHNFRKTIIEIYIEQCKQLT